MTTAYKLPSFCQLPWVERDYPNLKTPEFWANTDVFQPMQTLRWSRYGILFLPTNNTQTSGATLTYVFSDGISSEGNPGPLLRTMAAAGWRIVSFPFTGTNTSFFGELLFDPHNDLDEPEEEMSDAELVAELERAEAEQAEADAALEEYYSQLDYEFD